MPTISFHSRDPYKLKGKGRHIAWIREVILGEGKVLGHIHYVFTTDQDLLEMNNRFLGHDYFTDILTFDYTEGDTISGDIFISIDRVQDNALAFDTETEEELRRVMVHGVLHLMGYKDKTAEERENMRLLENEKMRLFHVEQ